jgi:hypothetical protein
MNATAEAKAAIRRRPGYPTLSSFADPIAR